MDMARSTGAARASPLTLATGLATVPSTLRIPLAGRAMGDAMFPHLAIHDGYAASVLQAIGDDGSRWSQDRHSIWGVLVRTRFILDKAQAFLQQHPDAVFLNLGCGLSQYFQWLDNGSSLMVDADLPEVMQLREQLLPCINERHHCALLDLTASDWWQQLPLEQIGTRPVFVMLEGVTMYLEPEQVQHLLHTLATHLPIGSQMVMDAFSQLACGSTYWHPSLRQTGAKLRWGLTHAGSLQALEGRLKQLDCKDVMAGYDWTLAMAMGGFTMLSGVPFYAMYLLSWE